MTISLIRKIKKIFGLKKAKPALGDDFLLLKKKLKSSKNCMSIDHERGVSLGIFEGTKYLLKIRFGNYIESLVYKRGVWQPDILQIISAAISGSDFIVIDVGANVGATTIPLAKAHPNNSFFAFEPHPEVYHDLCDNVSYNLLQNVKCFNLAISNADSNDLKFFAQKNAFNFGLSSLSLNADIGEYDTISVKCRSLDSYFEEFKQPVKVIKIDVQGHELSVLLSAEKIVSHFRPLILFELEERYLTAQGTVSETKNRIKSFFKTMEYDLFLIRKGETFYPLVTLDDYFDGDILAIPRAQHF